MRKRHQSWAFALGLLGLAAFAAAWLVFAPTQVGGSTVYSITEGNSMQPLVHKNDLALVRPQSSYRVGDVVLYESPVLHRPVLHRILVIQHGHYFFKGDNNDFVDPGYATRAELLGKLWVRLPAIGRIAGWLGKPAHAALFAASVAMLVLLGGAPSARGRRRNRREHGTAKASLGRHNPRFLDGNTRASLALFVILLLAGAMLLGIGFATPLHRSTALPDAYRQTGSFSYSADAPRASPDDPIRVAKTGEPIFTSLFDSVTLQFRYRFRSSLPHQIRGTIKLTASLLSESTGWQHLYDIEMAKSFTGDTAVTGGPVALKGLAALLEQLSTASGSSGDTYSVDLQPIVHVSGVVGGQQIRQTFSPVLPFSVTAAVIKLDVGPTSTPPGATYDPSTPGQALAGALNPVQTGSVPHQVANHLAITRYHISVFVARIVGLILAALALLAAIVYERLLRRDTGRPLEERIAAQFGCLVVPVDSLGASFGSTPIEMHDFTSLASLARYLERPILHQVVTPGGYAVDDDSRQYLYRAAAQPSEQTIDAVQGPPQPPAPGKPQGRRETRKRSRLPLAGGIGSLLIAVTLATSFTASTSVPTSNAGLSTLPRQLAQLAPAGCSSLTLTSIVLAAGNFRNNASNALVFGTAGNDNINDNGHNNCIIGGDGADHINGKTGDYCQIGPNPASKYNSCTTF